MSIPVKSFAGQNWLITPTALAVNENPPHHVPDQTWLLVLTGVTIVDIEGNNPHDWRRETVDIFPDIDSPLRFALSQHGVSLPTDANLAFELQQWAPFSAVSSGFDRDSGGVDAGFAVDTWRPAPFASGTDRNGAPVSRLFTGVAVDIAVRNDHAVLHRLSYHITLMGKIVDMPAIIIR